MASTGQLNLLGFLQNKAGISTRYLVDDPDYRAEFADDPAMFGNSVEWTSEQVDRVVSFLEGKIEKQRRI